MTPKVILIIIAFVIFILGTIDYPPGYSSRATNLGLALFVLSFLL